MELKTDTANDINEHLKKKKKLKTLFYNLKSTVTVYQK